MNYKVTLLLFGEDYFGSLYNNYLLTRIIFRSIKNPFLLILRRLHLNLKLPLFSLWYTSIKNMNSDAFLLFDTIYTPITTSYLRKKYPSSRIIVFFRNHINDENILYKFDSTVEIWSYDLNDCKKYNIRYNTQFYFKEIADLNYKESLLYDVFFVGKEKGRMHELKEIQKGLEDQGLKCFFYIIGNTVKERRKMLPYTEVIRLILHSKCILDLLPEEQHGMSLRPLEALFFKKKLITNYIGIKDSNFYDRRNILLLESISDIYEAKNFMKLDYVYQNKESFYSFKEWLGRFFV